MWNRFFCKIHEVPSLLNEPWSVPDVSALDQDGIEFSLRHEFEKGTWILFFYPKANTPGCTAQACSLRDAYEELLKKGLNVVGVSADDVVSQSEFAKQQRLPFRLLSDSSGVIRKAFGVKKIPLLGWSAREVFLIRDGEIIWHDASASTHQQADDILQVIALCKDDHRNSL